MVKTNLKIVLPLLAAMLLSCTGLRAAEQTPSTGKAPEAKTDREKDLEARIAALEKRVKELEQAQEAEPTPPPLHGRMFRGAPSQRQMDEMWNRFRGELEQEYGLNMPGFGPRGMMPGIEGRPRLGVELAPINDELGTRFRNSVKEGVFVMNVLPDSLADKAGLKKGDAITSFDGTPVKTPQELVNAVKNAPAGKHELGVTRRGEALKINVDLGAVEAEAEDVTADEEPAIGGGWMRRGFERGMQGGSERTRTEVKASALELTGQLARDLKLTDDQRKKMSEVLDKEAKALSDEVSKRVQTDTSRGFSIDMTANVNKLAEKHANSAEKELANVLSPEQLKQWNDHRKEHNSVSVSYSRVMESAPGESSRPSKDF
jgi:Spy/CpxP family protein refolding chaperone